MEIDNDLFSAFKKFIKALDELHGNTMKGLHLYAHLLERTGPQHGGAISRNCDLLKQFLTNNEEAILEKKHNLISDDNSTIRYSEKVFVNVKQILEKSDDDNQNVIWQHLLTCKFKADGDQQASCALEELKKLNRKSINGLPDLSNISSMLSSEDNPLPGLLNTIGGEKLAGTIQEIMSSPSFTNVMEDVKGKVESGEIDISQLQQNLMGSDIFKQLANGLV